MVPVHPNDSPLLGISRKGSTYIDKALPFGLRSAPNNFSVVADGLAWAPFSEGVEYSIHYLDDFLFCSPAASTACQVALQKALPLREHLGLPVAPEKIEGPCTRLSFLGITINSQSMTLSLPEAKLIQLKERLEEWTSATKHQLQELLGHLNHAATIVRPGRTFLRAVIEAMTRPQSPHQFTRLDTQVKANLAWWKLFVESWNGVSILPLLTPSVTVVSDASGSCGCGAFQRHTGAWLQLPWPEPWTHMNIAAKELLPIVLAVFTWGHQWADQLVHFLSDNAAVVAALNSRKAHHPALSHLLRCLFFVQASHNFEYSASHLPGKDNTAADAISRNNTNLFFISRSTGPTIAIPGPSPAGRPVHRHQPTLDISSLGEVAQSLFRNGLAPTSSRTYSSAKNRYLTFCSRVNLQPLPLSQEALCLYTAFLSQQGLAPSTISSYLSALRHLEIKSTQAVTDRSSWPYLQIVLKGIKRVSPKTQVPRLPITPDILRSLKAQWVDCAYLATSYRHTLLWATACTAYFGCLRLGEVLQTADKSPSLTADTIRTKTPQQ